MLWLQCSSPLHQAFEPVVGTVTAPFPGFPISVYCADQMGGWTAGEPCTDYLGWDLSLALWLYGLAHNCPIFMMSSASQTYFNNHDYPVLCSSTHCPCTEGCPACCLGSVSELHCVFDWDGVLPWFRPARAGWSGGIFCCLRCCSSTGILVGDSEAFQDCFFMKEGRNEKCPDTEPLLVESHGVCVRTSETETHSCELRCDEFCDNVCFPN